MKGIKSLLCLLGMVLASCACAQEKIDLSAFNAAAPRSILVVPVINESLNVAAADFLLTTLTWPLAEKGFYVFPVLTVKFVLEQEGLYEAEQIHRQPPEALANLFGADAVLYVTIKQWKITDLILNGNLTMHIEYKIVGKDGIEIWQASVKRVKDKVSLINKLLEAPLNDPLILEEKAGAFGINLIAFKLGPSAIPNGPYFKGQ